MGKNNIESNALLEAKNVSKIFRYGFFGFTFKALDRINFIMENKPQIYTIAGESGSGKSTFAKVILKVHKPDKGAVFYKGKNIHKLKGAEINWFRREIQAVFQDPYAAFNPMKKVYTYLHETAKSLLRLRREDEVRNYIDNALNVVGLKIHEIQDKYPHELSGGELQRVAIARALLTRPKLIIADEPVSMLDASLRVNILNIFREIKEKYGISFLYITHDLATAYYISDYIAILYRGSIIERGRVEDVLGKPLHPYTLLLIESLPDLNPRLKENYFIQVKLPGIEEKEFLTIGCKFAGRCGQANERCWKERPPEVTIKDRTVTCWRYY
ncbi:MAG: ABC transporter ATP-binding protein [Nitrososphaerota archaeon]|nr:ABC transporter ATP-binding protein [Nitrososphaerota archaeon]